MVHTMSTDQPSPQQPNPQPSRVMSDYIGIQVAEFRVRRGWTRADLAERTGLTLGVIRNIETARTNGTRRPTSVDELVMLAMAFGVNWTALTPAAPVNPRQRLNQPRQAVGNG